MTPLLFADLERDEGLRLHAYRDTVGRLTIGFGHAGGVAEGDVWTEDEATIALHGDVATAVAQLDKDCPWWRGLQDVRQDVMVELAFNMGIGRLETFHHALAAIEAADWPEAALQLRLSKWNGQVGGRARRLEELILTGVRP